MDELFTSGYEVSAFFDMTPDLVCIAGRDGYFKKVNHAVISKLEYTREELFDRPIHEFIHPDDRERTQKERQKLLSGNVLLNFENRYVSRSGKEIWLEWTSVYFAEKEVVFAIAKDISARKISERDIRERFDTFKSLATHFKASIERDRKYFAVELHEELAQLATVVKMDLDWLQSNASVNAEEVPRRLEHAKMISELLINTIRRISFSVSPLMLEDLGLSATLEWQCNEFSLLNGIPCQYRGKFSEKRLTHEMRLDIFRIFQESLTNIMYHALASQVTVQVEENQHTVILLITDNGKGFHPENVPHSPGITRMRQRARSINADLKINSGNTGTSVMLSIPL